MAIVNVHFPFSPGRGDTSPGAVPSSAPACHLPAATDLSVFGGRRLLCLIDEDNLRVSIRDHERHLSYQILHQRLQRETRSLAAWAIFTRPADDHRRRCYLQMRGWRVIDIPREIVTTSQGPVKKANADMDLCFAAGYLLQQDHYDAVLIGSGDGDLCIALARGIRRIRPECAIVTLSVPGSTSRRLTSGSPLFDATLLIGHDLTRPMHRQCTGNGSTVFSPFYRSPGAYA